MLRTVLLLLVTLLPALASAQINEIGLFAGGANYIGDVGPTTYIAPKKVALGLVYKWNRSPRHAYRFSATYGKLVATDYKSDVSGRQQRGYTFQNSIKEVSAGLEFNFFDFNLHEDELKITPYVHSGLSYFMYNEQYVLNGVTYSQDSKGSLAIPMTVGIKTNISRFLVLGAEVGARYTFTDNLDGSNHPDRQNLAFGNLESNDWYVFTGFTLTYTFGNKPCYCAE